MSFPRDGSKKHICRHHAAGLSPGVRVWQATAVPTGIRLVHVIPRALSAPASAARARTSVFQRSRPSLFGESEAVGEQPHGGIWQYL